MTPVHDDNRPVLIAYDGSDFAKTAITDAAGQLGPSRKAIVLTVWERLEEMPFLGIRGVAADPEAVETVIAETKAGAELSPEKEQSLRRRPASTPGRRLPAVTLHGDRSSRLQRSRMRASSCSAHAGARASATCSSAALRLRSPSTASARC
jgi:hypothetical protein